MAKLKRDAITYVVYVCIFIMTDILLLLLPMLCLSFIEQSNQDNLHYTDEQTKQKSPKQ